MGPVGLVAQHAYRVFFGADVEAVAALAIILEAEQLAGQPHGLDAALLVKGRASGELLEETTVRPLPAHGPVAQHLRGHFAQPTGLRADEVAVLLVDGGMLSGQAQ